MRTFQTVVDALIGLLSPVAPILVSIAFIFFLWGLVKFIRAAGDEKRLGEGKRMMGWGIIAIFVIISLWGLVAVLSNSFSGTLDNSNPVDNIDPLYDYDRLLK